VFDHRHYVPVLRWKRSEWNALRGVDESDRYSITHLIELAPKDFVDWRSKGPGFVLPAESEGPSQAGARTRAGSFGFTSGCPGVSVSFSTSARLPLRHLESRGARPRPYHPPPPPASIRRAERTWQPGDPLSRVHAKPRPPVLPGWPG